MSLRAWTGALFATFLVAASALTPHRAAAADAEDFAAEAKHAFLYDADQDAVLYAKSADTSFAPASLAKLMNLAVVFREIKAGRLSPDEGVPITEYAWRNGGGPARVSAMFAEVNSRVAVRDLISGVAVAVGNDAAIALSEAVSGSEKAFAEEMNRESAAIGLSGSSFVNATGLPQPGQRTTARDLGKLAHHLADTYPDLYRAFSEPELNWNRIRQRNRNPLIASFAGADGLLVGSTEGWGHIIVGSAVREGKRLIVVLAGLPTADARGEVARAMLDWGFTGFVQRDLFAAGQGIADASVFGGVTSSVAVAPREAVRIPVPREGSSKIEAQVVYRGPLRAPIARGDELARLKVWRDGILQKEVALVATDDVAQGALWQRALDATYELGVAAVDALVRRL